MQHHYNSPTGSTDFGCSGIKSSSDNSAARGVARQEFYFCTE